MAATNSVLALLLSLAPVPDSAAVRAPVPSAAADTTRTPHRVVRSFPPIEVRALLHDPSSSETVRTLSGATMSALPVDNFAEALALQPGVVAQGEELHIRGGRSGETAMFLDGIALNEPQWHRPMEVPLLALSSADLVTGTPEAQYGCGLAGALDLKTMDPSGRPTFAWRWQTALEDRWYDRVAARIGTPIRILGLGLTAAGDAALDDTWLPALRSQDRAKVVGASFDWRADNRVLGWAKLAPVDRPQRFSAQVLVSRRLQRPYDPAWTHVAWAGSSGDPGTPGYQPGHVAYNAADHLAVTDERRVATLLSLSGQRGTRRASVSLGWLRTRTVTSITGARGLGSIRSLPVYDTDHFHVVYGDYPLYRESGSDVLTLRGDAETRTRHGDWIKAGAGLKREEVSIFELDGTVPAAFGLDPLREYRARAPGSFAYVQGRRQVGGLVANLGLRAEYFTAGPEGRRQTLPWDGRGALSLSPRLGFAFPISVRDAFSMTYSRIHQAPGRDYLYDHRQAITNRQPLGNPALRPASVISYEAALKHLFGPTLALQSSVFYRDIYGQVGMRNYYQPGLPEQIRFVGLDDGHTGGLEWSLIHAPGERRRLEVHYTFMAAWGLESRPEGDPYGPVLDARVTPIGNTPLSWDRHHSFLLAATWPYSKDWTVSWSTAVGSPLPWTPKARRDTITDLALVNSRRLGWTESTNLDVKWTPLFAHGLTFGLELRNLFDNRAERLVSVDGYPNPVINTAFDDYAAYRNETGQSGGAFWVDSPGGGHWVPVHDPRLYNPPRTVRISVGADW